MPQTAFGYVALELHTLLMQGSEGVELFSDDVEVEHLLLHAIGQRIAHRYRPKFPTGYKIMSVELTE